MDKDHLLLCLAENGYNVSFGAKKHFATYDIVEKIPGFFALISLLIGVWQIYKPDSEYNNEVSVALIFLNIIALTISLYNSEKERYREAGNQLILLHNQLRSIYYRVKTSSASDFQLEEAEMNQIMDEYYRTNITKQIIMSDWYAHYKFFFQTQHEWIDEQKHFTWKDKIPFSFVLAIIVVIIIAWILLS
ncbi:SLATT domain-containing protein [Brevibacillus agri]|uniref:SLATT domain-containing protein n=1 Tax=Brevibacillus agri TaxID=51101 RepID=UPI002867DDCB|nr:SLATT domain-containing protein [Brevibacillus agri]